MINGFTPFSAIFDNFESKITDDLYLELTKDDTRAIELELLINALPYFEFCRQNLDYDLEIGCFSSSLTLEEINIISNYMVVEWLGRQIASVEVTRMKYSGSDFKFTSQANHLQKLLTTKKEYERLGFHFQRVYCRHRKDKDGIMRSTMCDIMEKRSRRWGPHDY